ncbi:MAG: carbohydrate ABC transporter permease [Firmicutes bacterium]|nr:carbohydrate ABC transporter permease [Bacillota bacterium]
MPPAILPRMGLTFENYRNLFNRMEALGQFGAYYRNSVIVTLTSVALILFVGCLAGYAIARLNFPGKNLVFFGVLAPGFFLPSMLNLFPQYMMMGKYGLIDTKTALILLYTAGGAVGAMFIMRGMYYSIPHELEDAAKIDGCSLFGIFWRIMLPLGRNGMIFVGVTNFVAIWNEYIVAATLTRTEKARTLGYGIMDLRGQWEYWDYGLLASITVLSFLPTVIIFIALQRHFMRGLSEGALKF